MMKSCNQHYLRSFIDSINTACQDNVFEKKADLSKKTKRNIGNTLIAGGISLPVLFSLRGSLKYKKFMELVRKGGLENYGQLDRAIAAHIRRTKAKLPKYKWEELTSSLMLRGKRTRATKSPVAVLKHGGLVDGSAYLPNRDIITLGKENILNPKILLHELGHAADPHLGEYIKKPGLTFGELFKGLINPENTRMMKAELRAWNNAKVLNGDILREAALDTYRNAIRGHAATRIVTPSTVIGGAILRSKNKEEKVWPKSAQARLKPISYFDKYNNGDPELDSIFAERRRARELEKQKREQQQARFRRNRMFQQQVLNRQSTMAPIRQVPLWNGKETRTGGAGVEQYFGKVTPYRNTTIAAPGTSAQQAAANGQARWEDLPSTRMMMAANRQPGGGTPDIKKMMAENPASAAKWDRSSAQAYLGVRQRAQARQAQTAESAAYNEILKRLNAKNVNGQYDAKTIQERARRLAPLVAKNYRRNENGEWNLVDQSKKQMLSAKARGIGAATMPVQPAPLPQQIAQHPAAPAAPAAPVAPAVQKPAVPTTPATPAAPVQKA